MRLIALSLTVLAGVLTLSAGSTVAYAAPEKETNKSAKTVKIQPGDSLTLIAEANGSTAQRLFDANLKIENPDLIFPGDELRVPAKDEELATRPMPASVTAVAPAAPITTAAAPQRSTQRAAAPAVSDGSVWDRLAECESGGNWAINTGNGFYGGLQFTISSWQGVGGSGLPSDASREEQIMRGQMLQSRQGWGAWPACSAKLGLS